MNDSRFKVTGAAEDVVTAFFEAVRQHPKCIAIVSDGEQISYEELAARVLRFAASLGDARSTVAVLVTRSANTVIALLAILASGGCYCPIDPSFPRSRQAAMARAAACAAVVRTALAQQPLDGFPVFDLPFETAGAHATGERLLAATVQPNDPAYLLTTSGSSGTAKAVVTPRGALSAAVLALRESFGVGAGDRVLQFASLNWDTCFEEILPTLTSGATLVFDAEAYTGSLPRLLRMIAAQRITVLDLPTAFWHELVRYLVEERLALPSALRLVVIGGEAARAARVADWCELDSGRIRLLNTYGCTETTLVTHAAELHGPRLGRERSWRDARAVPIGNALPHVIEYVNDEGELLIGGPALALGYFGAPELTRERFVEIDRGSGPQRYFRTGDRVERDELGELTHHGRSDGQIKVRGMRVEPAEVEAQIAEHPAVHAVAVVGVTVAEHTALRAYVVPSAGANRDALAAELLRYLRERAPVHLIPSQLQLVSELVYTGTGKVDRAGSHQRYSQQRKKDKELTSEC